MLMKNPPFQKHLLYMYFLLKHSNPLKNLSRCSREIKWELLHGAKPVNAYRHVSCKRRQLIDTKHRAFKKV